MEHGEERADQLGQLYEIVHNDNDEYEKNMDLWNNDIGRELGKQAKSKEELVELLKDALNNGDLITDPYSDPRKYDPGTSSDDSPLPEAAPLPGGSSGLNELLGDLFDKLREKYEDAKDTSPQRKDPLAIDLDMDGVETVSTENGVYFDLDKNGYAEKTGWIDRDDALLVRDLKIRWQLRGLSLPNGKTNWILLKQI